jgi:plastocyanin
MTRIAIYLVGLLLAQSATAGALRVSVVNDESEPVSQAVVYARPLGAVAPAPARQRVMIDQVDKEFVPELTVVYQGAEISFPNNDNIRHHVYSFSRPNAFEIPLYADQAAPPVTFASPGVVALGCNVHDWMSAYVFVADTPYYSVTTVDGSATLDALPAGDYEVEIWHAQLRGKPEAHRQVISVGEAVEELSFSIRQKPVWKAWRGSDGVEDY